MNITKETWREILDLLCKHKIPYTVRCEERDIQRAMEDEDITVTDKHIQINLVIQDYFDDNK